MVSKYFDWVNEGQYVNARFASELGGDRVYGSGKVIAYTDQPTLTVLRADGARFSWIANLCEAAEEPTTEQDGAPSASAGGAPASKLCFAPVGQNGRGLAIRCDLPWGHPGAHHGVAGIDYGLTVRTAIPEPFRRMFWVAAEDLANVIGCTVVEGEPRGYGEPDPRDAEIERMRGELCQIRDIALVVLGVLPDDDDRSAVDLVREILEGAGPEKLRRDNRFRDLVAERDRKRRELADVTSDRDRWQARYNRLIGGALAVQQHLQRAHGQPETAVTSEYMGPDFSRSMVDGLRDGKEKAEASLAAEQRNLLNEMDEHQTAQALTADAREEWKRADVEVTRLTRCYDAVTARADEVEAERNRLRQDLDDIRSRAKAIEVDRSSKTVLLSRIQDVLNEADTKPAEPRRFYAHSPEPEVGTVVGLPDRKPGGPTWTRHPAGGWQRSNSPGYRMAWKSLFGDCGELVEVVTTDG